jgi:hypothetical protein
MKSVWWKVVLLSVVVVFSLAGCDWLLGMLNPSIITWSDTASGYRDQVNDTMTFTLVAGGSPGTVWGTDVYTDDSSIGTAAVHAGLITFAAGGTVTIRILPGQASYSGTTRNGVTSLDYGEWPGSFEFVTD